MITRVLLGVLIIAVLWMVKSYIAWRKTQNEATKKEFLLSTIVTIIVFVLEYLLNNISSAKAIIMPVGSDISINTPIAIYTQDDFFYKAYYTFNEGLPRKEGKKYTKEIFISNNDVKNGKCTIYVDLKLFGIIPVGQEPAHETYTIIPAKGDISNDGKIDAYDASMLLKEIAKSETGKDITEISRYDIDGDGKITNNDAAIILKYYSYVMVDDNKDKISFDEYVMFTK